MAEDTRSDARTKVWELLGRFQAAMLVTRSQGGVLSGRPMSHIVEPNEGIVYILTERTSDAARDIEGDPAALLTFADDKSYLSITVRGAVSDNRNLIAQLWNTGAQAFWPQGPSDPKVCALILKPDAGEYWDGDNIVAAGAKMLVANLTGTPPDLGDHGTARL